MSCFCAKTAQLMPVIGLLCLHSFNPYLNLEKSLTADSHSITFWPCCAAACKLQLVLKHVSLSEVTLFEWALWWSVLENTFYLTANIVTITLWIYNPDPKKVGMLWFFPLCVLQTWRPDSFIHSFIHSNRTGVNKQNQWTQSQSKQTEWAHTNDNR